MYQMVAFCDYSGKPKTLSLDLIYLPIYTNVNAVILFDSNTLFLVPVVETFLKCKEYVVNLRFWLIVTLYCAASTF